MKCLEPFLLVCFPKFGKNQFRPLILQEWLLKAYDCAYSLVGFSSEWVWVEGSKAKCLEPFLLVCFPKFGKNQFRPLILQKWLLEAYDCAYSLVGFSSEWVWVEGSKVKCLEPFLLVCFPKFGKTQFRPLILQKWLLEAYDCAYSLEGFSSEWVWVEGSKVKCLEPFLLVCFPKFCKNQFRPLILQKWLLEAYDLHIVWWAFHQSGCGRKGLRRNALSRSCWFVSLSLAKTNLDP